MSVRISGARPSCAFSPKREHSATKRFQIRNARGNPGNNRDSTSSLLAENRTILTGFRVSNFFCVSFNPLRLTIDRASVAYTALPLVLTALDLKLSVGTSQVNARRRHLDVYVNVMKLYRKKYDGTEQVSDVIEKILAEAEPQARRICGQPESTSTPSSLALSSKSRDWGDIFSHDPKVYLRLTLALDMSFSRGEFPQDCDFPNACRLGERGFIEDSGIEIEPTEVEALSTAADEDTRSVEMQERSSAPPSNLLDGISVNLDFADLFEDHRRDSYDKSGSAWIHELSTLLDLPA